MRIAKRTYISEILQVQEERILQRIREKKALPSLYCITLPLWESAILEIYPYQELRDSFFDSYDIIVTGVAVSEEDALVLLQRMISDLANGQMLDRIEEYFCGD